MKRVLAFVLLLSYLLLVSSFKEEFDSPSWSEKWIISEDPEYLGKWNVQEADDPYRIENDKGLVVLSESRRHAISTKFDTPVVVDSGSKLIFQYEVKLQNQLSCGGAYIKLFAIEDFDPLKFNAATPYSLMFGPDKCGSEGFIHLIVRHQNKISGLFEEKHLNPRITASLDDKIAHLYKLVVDMATDDFEVSVDNELVQKGNFLDKEIFSPSFQPSKMIPDPDDVKPADWVDSSSIDDPDSVKPADWDVPESIPEPGAVKPDDWNEEDDGEWEAPLVSNPEYKGEWRPKKIPNPAYKGEWAPRNIPNANYYEVKNPASSIGVVSAIGIEIWTLTSKIMFDNILVTSDLQESKELTDLWIKKHDIEKRIMEKEIELAEKSSWSDRIIDGFLGETLRFTLERPIVAIPAIILILFVPIMLVNFACGGRERRNSKKPSAEVKSTDTDKNLLNEQPTQEKTDVTKTRPKKD